MRKRLSTVVIVGLLAAPVALAQAQTPPNFLNLVALGDSLTMGVKNGGVNEVDQSEAYPALIARQVRTFFFLPLLHGPTTVLVEPGLPPVTQVIPADGVGRVFPLIVPQNLAIGGADVADGLTDRPDFNSIAEINSLVDLVLGLPLGLLTPPIRVSQVELAVGSQPTFTIFWLGANDVLGSALRADPGLITPFPVFTAAYQQAVGAILTLTNSKIIVANIPDVTAIAFLISAQELADFVGAPLAAIGPALGIADGDFVTLPGLALVEPILAGQNPGPLPGSVVLTAAETQATLQATVQMNAFIQAFAAQLGFPVVDAFTISRGFEGEGVQVGDFNLTSDFLGGIYSLDGFHPTATGQGLIANAFIERMNGFWGLNIPLVDVAAIAAGDDLVLKPSPPPMSLRTLKGIGFDAARRAIDIASPDRHSQRPVRPAKASRDGGR